MATPSGRALIRSTYRVSETPRVHVGPYAGAGAEWDGFLRSTARTGTTHTHCHLYGWKRIMQSAMGHDAPYIAARDASGALRGVLPLVRIRSRLFGHYLISMPFLNYGGPVGDSEAITALARYAATMADDCGATLLEMRCRGEIPSGRQFAISHRKITVLMDMSGGSEALWRRLPSKVRSQIRRPAKDGVIVQFGSDQVAPFYSVFARHMRDLGTPVMSRRFFELAAQEFGENALFAVAYRGATPVACGAGFACGEGAEREFEIVWASALREYSRTSANMLIYWEVMKRASDAGARTFNFGRCTPGGNTHRFKKQWGTTDAPLWWYDHAPRGVSPPSEHSEAARLGARLWTHMPLPAANALGPRIVRLLPL
ncbi:MAG: FemAB family PEP-CTERM system-associated protein [Gemmatimonadota bacterium]|nr:FemAB family PEP-CTERM system-associated protein [Gemmatimonadota bacterium]